MAKIKFGMMMTDARGKLGGQVFSKNKSGAYVRTKVTPLNPQTSYQQNQRARLSAVSQAWSGLSESIRSGFAALADQHPFTNIFGDQVKLDGKSFFSKLSLNRLSAGQAILAAVPAMSGVPFISILSAAWEKPPTDLKITIDQATVPAGFTLVVQATDVLKSTTNFFKNQFRELGTATAAAGVVDLSSLYDARFPGSSAAANATDKIAIRVFLVNNTSGESGIASQIVVSPTP